jgi:hypothetical protein
MTNNSQDIVIAGTAIQQRYEEVAGYDLETLKQKSAAIQGV